MADFGSKFLPGGKTISTRHLAKSTWGLDCTYSKETGDLIPPNLEKITVLRLKNGTELYPGYFYSTLGLCGTFTLLKRDNSGIHEPISSPNKTGRGLTTILKISPFEQI